MRRDYASEWDLEIFLNPDKNDEVSQVIDMLKQSGCRSLSYLVRYGIKMHWLFEESGLVQAFKDTLERAQELISRSLEPQKCQNENFTEYLQTGKINEIAAESAQEAAKIAVAWISKANKPIFWIDSRQSVPYFDLKRENLQIRIVSAIKIDQVVKKLYFLQRKLISKDLDVKIIVLDSVHALYASIAGNYSENWPIKLKEMYMVLKKIAKDHGIAVLTTNSVRRTPSGDIPALGPLWANMLDSQYILINSKTGAPVILNFVEGESGGLIRTSAHDSVESRCAFLD